LATSLQEGEETKT